MRGLRLSLAHAVLRRTQEAQEAETKMVEEVDEQPSNRQELVFEIVHSTSASLQHQSHPHPHSFSTTWLPPHPLFAL